MSSRNRRPLIGIPEGLKLRQATERNLHPWLFPLEDPSWVAPPEASHMRDDDPLIVVTPAARSYVLPWWVMKNHHVANLLLDGDPVTVTLCERCSSAAGFDTRIEGERRTFQVIGWWKGTHVVADYETESIWASFTGECIWGYHRGTRLRHLPTMQMSWMEASSLPDAFVADGVGESREGHGCDRWPGSEEPPMQKFAKIDERLPHNELVLGIQAGDTARAYRLADLKATGGALHDNVNGLDIVILSGSSGYSAAAFEPRVGDRLVRFRSSDGRVEDEDTGSVWSLTGFALSGQLAGKRLKHVVSPVEEWYAWAAYHPGTELAGR